MAKVSYTYSVSVDFPNHKVDPSRLADEIGKSQITIALDTIYVSGDACNIGFKADLSAEDHAILDAIVTTHSGEPLPSPAQLVQLDGPLEADKKPVVVVSPATTGLLTWLAGRGDSEAGRGLGPQLRVDFTGPEAKVLEFGFSEPVEVNDGQVWWRPSQSWGPDDEFSLGIRMPGTVAAETPGTGNANAVQIAPGMFLYVPAAGDGSHTIDLAQAVPVKAKLRDGYWDVGDFDGAVTPCSNPGTAGWNLLSFDVVGYLIRGISCGHPLGVWDIDVYKTEWVHQNWKLRLEVSKVTAGEGTLGGWLLTFRENVT